MSVNTVNNDGSLSRIAGGLLYADAPIASIIPFGGSVIPSGYLLCNGAEVLKTAYAELFAVIGDAFGTASDNTKFKLPDLRGEFLRGAGTNSHGGQGDGGTVGQHQDATEHLEYNVLSAGQGIYIGVNNSSEAGKIMPRTPKNTDNGINYGSTKRVTVNSSLTTEESYQSYYKSRPTNTSVNYIIKAKQVAAPADFMDAIEQSVEDVYGDVIPSNASSSNKLATQADIPNIIPLAGITDCNSIFYGLVFCDDNVSHKPISDQSGMLLSFMKGTVQNQTGVQIFIPYSGYETADFYFRDNTNGFSAWRKLNGQIMN